jgi:hypothetical protein
MSRKAPVDTMSSGPQRFKRTEFKRAVRSAEEAGLRVQRIEVDPKTGKISLVVAKPSEDAAADAANEWDAP